MSSDVAKLALEFAKAIADATPVLFRLFSEMGSRDKFLAALDGVLATARAKTDSDLKAKQKRRAAPNRTP